MDIEIGTADDSFASDLLRGAPEISKFIDEPVPRVYYLAGKQILPIGRLGSVLIASKRRLREHYERLTQGVEPQPQSRPSDRRAPEPSARRRRHSRRTHGPC